MRNHLRTFVLLGAMSALLVAVGGAFAPDRIGMFAVMALGMNLAAYFFSHRLVLAMHHAREIGPGDLPGLHRTVADLAERAGIPKPRLYLIPEPQPNAFATGRNPAHGVVAVTRGLLDLLDERELRGVLAHELAHIRNRDILVATIAAALGSLVTYLSHAAFFFGGHRNRDGGGSPAGGLLLVFLGPIAATLIQLGISRSREFLADETGARLTGDPEGLARALGKLERGAHAIPAAATPATASLFIVNPLGGAAGAVLRLFSTHPPIALRVAKLREMIV